MAANPQTAHVEVLFPSRSRSVADSPLPRHGNNGESLPVALLGVPFDHVTLEAAVERIHEMVASRQPHYVVTPNVDFLVQARRDVELRHILINAHLVLCDGTPVLWASRWFNNALPERVAGADLVPRLIETATTRGWRIFFLGGAPDVASRAVRLLQAKHPTLNICGHYSPPFRSLLEMDHEGIAERIRAAKPDLLFVSFGCPKAEKWIAMHYRSLGVPVAIGVGATIDFLAGQVKRAPVWAQRSGLEWAFRLAQEPRRLGGRYATDLLEFTRAITGQSWCMQMRTRGGLSTQHAWPVLLDGDWESIEMPACLDASAVRINSAIWNRTSQCHLAIDLAEVRFIDSTGVGLLLWLQKRFRKEGRCLVLVAPSRVVRKALVFAGHHNYFRTAESAEEARQLVERERNEPPTCCPNEDGRVLYWRGEITSENVEAVWEATRKFVAAPARAAWKIWIDLASVRFLDSSGAALMARTKRLAQSDGTVLSFTGAPPVVCQVLRSAGLDHLLEDSL